MEMWRYATSDQLTEEDEPRARKGISRDQIAIKVGKFAFPVTDSMNAHFLCYLYKNSS
ncbi:hypothetical protein IPA_07600 [Ignicoccus pacificus DSM 13166]|uniref:Uncharacterized protein n=1 Tax=Ignicoccus pacificus DSM 13166 TaxID=940294 RepID=A0A977PL71_9CREN|nr:hypothetical protein IPA_07600 [Ignicoccus pacificus DSM 13166]